MLHLLNRSPLGLLIVVAAFTFLIEALDEYILRLLPPLSEHSEVLVDSAILVLFISPVLYFFLFRPLFIHIKKLDRAESELQSYHEHMEGLVEERTAKLKKEVRERSKAERSLIKSEEKYSNLFHLSNDAIFLHDLNGNIIDVNERTLELFGYTRPELLSLKVSEIHPHYTLEASSEALSTLKRNGFVNFDIDFTKSNGKVFTAEVSSSIYKSGGETVVQGVVRDITYRKRFEEHLKELTFVDELTGIANRRSYEKAIRNEWHRAKRAQKPISVIMIDIDQFKLYNDTFGHAAGDECLKIVAATLKSVIVRSGDFIARYGGEEFVVVLPGASRLDACQIAEKMRKKIESLDKKLFNSDVFDQITISLGVASEIPANNASPEALVAAADDALYAAKDAGRNIVMEDGDSEF